MYVWSWEFNTRSIPVQGEDYARCMLNVCESGVKVIPTYAVCVCGMEM